jgi:hypothetical protein
MSLVAGLTAPVLANESSNVPDEPSGAELLYLSLKANGDDIPQWLIDELFPTPKDLVINENDREGGETWTTALAITTLPYTDTGNTSDNIHNAVTVTGTNICAGDTWTTLPGKDVWYSITLGSPTMLTISLCGSTFDTKLAVFVNNAGVPGNCVARDDDDSSCSPSTLASKITNCTLPAGSYFIDVDAYGSNAGGAYTLNVTGPCIDTACPAGFTSSYEIEVPGGNTNGGCNSTPPVYESIASGDALCGTTWADANQRDTDWYQIVLTQSSTITVNMKSVCAPMSAIVFANGCPVGTALATATAGSGGLGTATTACLLPGTYQIAVVPTVFTGYPAAGMWHYGLGVSTTPCVHPCDTYTCTPLVLSLSQSYVDGNTTGHTNVAGNAAPDDFYCFTARYDCAVTFTTCDERTVFTPSNDTYLRLWSAGGPCGGGTQLATNDDDPNCTTGGTPYYRSTLTYNVLAGQSYVIQVEGFGTNAGPYRLHVAGDCIIVDAQDVPAAFTLGQNVPNPFNPTTTISYSMPETGMASLKVFDVAGRMVATLVDGMVEQGAHSVVFDAGNLTSGVYFYTLQAGASSETRKMVLMK